MGPDSGDIERTGCPCGGGGPAPHKLPQARLVRKPGRMLIGVTMPVPAHLGEGVITVPHRAAVATAGGKRARRSLPGAAVAMACAVAFGSAPSMTEMVTAGEPARSFQPLRQAGDTSGTLLRATSVKAMAMPSLSIAGLSSAIIHVAQQDVPGLEVSNISGSSGKALRVPLKVIGGEADEHSFLMFRGLPAGVTLSAGFRLKESWAISLRDIGNVTIKTPPDFQGAFNIEVLLIKGRDMPAQSQMISVEIVKPDSQQSSTAALGPPAPGPQVLTAAPRTPDVERQGIGKGAPLQVISRLRPSPPSAEEPGMMGRAEALLRNNDVASARLLFEHLANNGSARAALAMGKTYDPAFFRNIASAGVKPDLQKARQWYRQAADLGDQEARTRLSALASR